MEQPMHTPPGDDANHIQLAHPEFDESIVMSRSPRSTGARPRQPELYVSDVQIRQLVSIALQHALDALSQPDAEKCLHLRACEIQAGMREALSSLTRSMTTDAAIRREHRNAVVFQKLTLDLALKFVNTIRRYAKVYEREIPATVA